VALADAVREELRDTDFAARYGGDEFVVLLPQTNEPQGAQFAERLRRRLVQVSQDAGLPVRGSIGVAAVNADELDSRMRRRTCCAAPDEALYRAKRIGTRPRRSRPRPALGRVRKLTQARSGSPREARTRESWWPSSRIEWRPGGTA